jgi:hypothetical protein
MATPGELAGSNPKPFAVVRTLDDLRRLFRQRFAELEITYQTADRVAGLTAGYTAKLLGPHSTRLTSLAIECLLGATGTKLLAVEDTDALARVKGRLVARRRRLNTKRASPSECVVRRDREFMRKIGQWGGFKSGQVRRTALSNKKRVSERNRQNVLKRWHPQETTPG